MKREQVSSTIALTFKLFKLSGCCLFQLLKFARMCIPLPVVRHLSNNAPTTGSWKIAGNHVVCAQVGDLEFLEIQRFQ